jgi:DNA-binding HxlR family transcriptional regulator
MDGTAYLFRVLSKAGRLEIMRALVCRSMTVKELKVHTGLSSSSIYYSLGHLEALDLVLREGRREPVVAITCRDEFRALLAALDALEEARHVVITEEAAGPPRTRTGLQAEGPVRSFTLHVGEGIGGGERWSGPPKAD